jgi:hypothetical protein
MGFVRSMARVLGKRLIGKDVERSSHCPFQGIAPAFDSKISGEL